MKIITVDTSRKYNIIILNRQKFAECLLSEINELVKDNKYSKLVFIVDNNLKDFYSKDFLLNIINIRSSKNKLNIFYLNINISEKLKNRATKEKIEDKLLELNCGRDTILVAIGGGVLLDIIGFVAATYQRGVPVVYVPTSLLAMVDASIGGKTAVNTDHGKNLIGIIKQPSAVIIDIDNIDSLSDIDYYSALAEVIKVAIIYDKELYKLIVNNINLILNKDKVILEKLIYISINIKKLIVQQDELESGMRELLNFGHTVGHAIEKLENYNIPHGYAVALGLWVESKIAYLTGKLGLEDLNNIKLLLYKIYYKKIKINNQSYNNFDSFKNLFLSDKKTKNNQAHFVLISSIGNYYSNNNKYSFVIDDNIINQALTVLKNKNEQMHSIWS